MGRTCPKTCGLCQEEQPSQEPEETEPPQSDTCVDTDIHCATSYKQYCSYEHIKRACPKTCGLCQEEQPSQEPEPPQEPQETEPPQSDTCVDTDMHCATSYKQYC